MIRQFTRTILAVATAFGIGTATADEHGHAHPHFAPDVDAFHAILAPIWHAQPGQARSRNACAKAGAMAKSAAAIKSTDATALAAAVAGLKTACAKRGDVDAALSDVHEAFHRLIEAPAAAH